MIVFRIPRLICFLAAAMLLGSCGPLTNDGYIRRTASAANDRIMLVRDQPLTFGYTRLTVLSQLYPDLGLFIEAKGYPEFLAETMKGGNRYLILYYLKERKAFACRSGSGKSRQVEFSGPYPITDREADTLKALLAKSTEAT